MKRAAAIGVLFVLSFLLMSPFAIGDQTLTLAFSNCIPGGGTPGAELDGVWGPNVNKCQKAAINIQSTFRCFQEGCMNNCNPGCSDCNIKFCVEASITMNNACTAATSPLWKEYEYVQYRGWVPLN
jgi:hypothetical protein